jgi:hypothetical protein
MFNLIRMVANFAVMVGAHGFTVWHDRDQDYVVSFDDKPFAEIVVRLEPNQPAIVAVLPYNR